jgi:beta-xylosidase
MGSIPPAQRAGDCAPYHWLWLVACGLAAFAFGCAAPSEGRKAAVSQARTYTNPVYSGSMPDPSVIRYQGFYYAFGTTGGARTPHGRIFTALRSRDLVDWETPGGALVPPSTNRRVQYWAPEVTHNGDTFYLYYSMGGIEPEKFEIRIATSPRPKGPYVDIGHQLVDCESNRFTIDPFPFRDDDGQWHFFYARNFANSALGEHPGTPIAVDRLIDMTSLAGDFPLPTTRIKA